MFIDNLLNTANLWAVLLELICSFFSLVYRMHNKRRYKSLHLANQFVLFYLLVSFFYFFKDLLIFVNFYCILSNRSALNIVQR